MAFRTLLFLGCCFPNLLAAQPLDTLPLELPSVQVVAARMGELERLLPLSASVLADSTHWPGEAGLSLSENLLFVPGLFFLNPDNYAQDLRLSIRGFGSRAAFGIRGVKVLLDGFPETTPDGQTQVDNLPLEELSRLEVLKGTPSGLYGNAAGGVLSLQTREPPPEGSRWAVGATGGSYGLRKVHLSAGGGRPAFGWQLGAVHTALEGYREHSALRSTLLNAKLQGERQRSRWMLALNFADSPRAEDPGALTAEQMHTDPRQARDRNLQFDAGEAVRQGRAGLRLEHRLPSGLKLHLKAFHLLRDFDNRLPFESGGQVDLRRGFSGLEGALEKHLALKPRLRLHLQGGLSLERQSDRRRRYDNLEGQRGPLAFDQTERFHSGALFLLQQWQWGARWTLLASLRLDALRLQASDHYLNDGDDSGRRSYTQLNPLLGLSFRPHPTLTLFADAARSFETPALSELSANPDGSGGFNPHLQPQTALTLEGGLKFHPRKDLRTDLSLFLARVEGELVPFESADFPGRSFFQNAGRSTRRGIEWSGYWRASPQLAAGWALSYGRFVFERFPTPEGDFAGKLLPGVPQVFGGAFLHFAPRKGSFLRAVVRWAGKTYADNANAATADAFARLDLRAGTTLRAGKLDLSFFGGLNNLTGSSYAGNVRINAFGGRFFEPAPRTNFYLGVRLGNR